MESQNPPKRRSSRKVWWVASALSVIAVLAALLTGVGPFANSSTTSRASSAARPTPVDVASAKRGDIELFASYRGELIADAADLASETSGRLDGVTVDIGDVVKKGQELARVDAKENRRLVSEARSQVRTAEAAKRRAQAELAGAKVDLERARRLAKEEIVSQQEVDTVASRVNVLQAELDSSDAQRAQASARVATLDGSVKDARILAPFDGAVAERYLNPGAQVQAGTTILRLVRAGPLRVRFRVPERELAQVEEGRTVSITTQSTKERQFAGTVTRISAEVSRLDRSIAVEAVLQGETDVLRPGMFAEVQMSLGKLTDAVLIPSPALVERVTAEGKPEVGAFVVVKGRARWKPVTVTGRTGDTSAVKGLEANAKVVVMGVEALRDDVAVRVLEQGGP